MKNEAVREHGSTCVCSLVRHHKPDPSFPPSLPSPPPSPPATPTTAPDYLASYSYSNSFTNEGLVTPSPTPLVPSPGDDVYEIAVINIGDSRCLVLSQGLGYQHVFSTVDHRPVDAVELQRIQEAGGGVAMGRVDGKLALSRTIGLSTLCLSNAFVWK